jgi:hypothetical protein
MEDPMKRPTALLASLLLDFSRLDPHVKGLNRDIQTIERRFKHEGYGFLTIALPALGAALDKGLSTGCFSCPTHFRRCIGSALPRFLSGLLSEVFEPISGLVKEDASVSAIVSLRQLSYFFKKVRLEDEDSDKLHSKAVTEFFRCDEMIDQNILSDRDSHLHRVVCRMLLPHLNFEAVPLGYKSETICKHGPGAVMEGYSPNQKWKGVTEAILTDGFDTIDYQYDLFRSSHSDSLSESGRLNRSHDNDAIPLGVLPFTVASGGIAKLISVAKNSTSRRTITIEPLMNQFVQQSLNRMLRYSIEKCPILSGCLALTDQSQNQKLALEGSITRRWSTLDLKSASDLLSCRIVENTFSHKPLFLEAMMGCRSSYVSEGGNPPVKIRKYAGMGNATTFPVQSVVFATLAITAILSNGYKKPTFRDVKHAARHVRVFGDDIIVDTRHVHVVVDWLTNAGLIVNVNKSFFDGYFKESCGVDAYKGVDVTPIYCRHRPEDSSTEAGAIAGLVALSNNAWTRGLYKMSDTILREVEERLGYALPLVSKDSSALGWTSRIDAMSADSWCSKLQSLTLKARVLSQVHKKDKLDGVPALLKFFHVPLIGRPLEHLIKSSVRFKLRISKKRVLTKVS